MVAAAAPVTARVPASVRYLYPHPLIEYLGRGRWSWVKMYFDLKVFCVIARNQTPQGSYMTLSYDLTHIIIIVSLPA